MSETTQRTDNQEEEVLMENVTPEDLPTKEEAQQKEPYVPSPRWKRNMAWILFAVVAVGVIFWLLGIAFPEWAESLRSWLGLGAAG